MRKIEITECHQILLAIAKQVDKICKDNDIPYYMLGGTMLGAIRHKGFIPWDDDLDLGIERKYYNKFIAIASDMLDSKKYKVSTYLNDERVVYGVTKIQDLSTLISDPRNIRPLDEQLGINIDIFPLDESPDLGFKYQVIKFLMRMQTLLFVESTKPTLLKNTTRRIIRFCLPINKTCLPNAITKIILGLKGEKIYMGSFWSGYGKKHIMKKGIWGNPVSYPFEDTQLFGVEKSHEYLSTLMSNYMKLPPVEERMVHCENIYSKSL